MKFDMHLELRIKKKCEKPLLSKLRSEINSPCNGVDYHIQEALDKGVDMNSTLDVIETAFGLYDIFYSRCGDVFTASGSFDDSESYEFSRIRLFDSISQYLENGSYLTINGKGVEVAGGKVEFI